MARGTEYLIASSMILDWSDHKTGSVGAAFNVLVGQSSKTYGNVICYYDENLDYMGWSYAMDIVTDIGRQVDGSKLSLDLKRILVAYDYSRKEIARHSSYQPPVFKGIVTDKQGMHVKTHEFLPHLTMDEMKAFLRAWVADHGGRAYRDWQIVQVIPGASSFAEE